jgi:hypothetical protein
VEEGRQDLNQVQERICTYVEAIVETLEMPPQRLGPPQLSSMLVGFVVGSREAGQELQLVLY